MTEICCIRYSDLIPLLHGVRDEGPYFLSHVPCFSTKERRVWRLDGESETRFLSYAQDFGIPYKRKPIDFPKYMRWGNRTTDRLIALVPEEDTSVFRPLAGTRRAIERFEAKNEIKVEISNGNGQCIQSANDDVFHIIINGSPQPAPPQEGDIDWYHNVYTHPPLGGGLNRGVGGSFQSIADQVDNTITVRLALTTSVHADELLSGIIERASLNINALSQERRRFHTEKVVEKLMHSFLQRYVEHPLERKQNRLEQSRQKVNFLLEKIDENARNIQSFQAQIRANTNVQRMRERALEDFQRLEQIDKITNVHADKNGVQITTSPLLITNPDTGERHLGGRYKITFSGSDDITIKNLSRRINGTHHPHIQGRPCWGNLSEILPKLLSDGQIAAATIMVIAYLETCNPSDTWGSSISNWPLAPS